MNRLDAIVFAITSVEITNNSFQRCCSRLKSDEYTGLDLVIFINNSNYPKGDLLFLNSMNFFRAIIIINLSIHPEEDIYIIDPPQYAVPPKYGFISGPNIMFFRIMSYCKKYNTVLLLESDTIIKPNAIKTSIDYVKNTNFLISGSKYLGSINIDNEAVLNHINGVAFYRTGSDELQVLLNNIKKFKISTAASKN